MADSFPQFVQFFGVVEDRLDPLQLGRVKVRCVGWHTEYRCDNKNANDEREKLEYCLDVEDLPWAIVAQPATSGGGMSGLGASVPSIVEGTWVTGFFRDGDEAQFPIITHVLPGVSECPSMDDDLHKPDHKPKYSCSNVVNKKLGFVDNEDRDLEKFPRMPKKVKLKVGEDSAPGSFRGYEKQALTEAQKESCDEDLAKGEGDVGVWIEEHDKAENYPLHGDQEYAYLKDSLLGHPDSNRLARGLEKALEFESPEREPAEKVPEYDPEEPEEVELLKHHEDSHISWKLDNIDEEVPTADIPKEIFVDMIPRMQNFYVGPSKTEYHDAETLASPQVEWNEPPSPFAAVFPFNHVHLSESGHLFEVDDTPGRERLHRMHRSGTFEEIHPDGTIVRKIVGENYTIIMKNEMVHIEANSFTTVDKACKIFINADRQKGNNFDIHVGKGGALNVRAEGCVNVIAEESITLATKETLRLKAKNMILDIEEDLHQIIGDNKDTTIGKLKDEWVGKDETRKIKGHTREEVVENKLTEVKKKILTRSEGVHVIVGNPITENPAAVPKIAEHKIPDVKVSNPKPLDEDSICSECD